MIVARHLRIRGRVQGVWYRGWAVDAARSLGLTGWVRNCGDGTVEAVVQGDESAVERFVQLAHEGPAVAQVTRVEANAREPDGSLATFRQDPSV